MINNLLSLLTFENIYLVANWGVIPFWLLLVFLPNHHLTNFFVQSVIVPILLSSGYAYLSYKIYLKSNWKEIKCAPLSIIQNNILNIDKEFDPMNECFINNKFKESLIKDNENLFYKQINNLTLLIQEIRGENEKANKGLNKYYNDSISEIKNNFNELNNNKNKLNKDIETNKNNINVALTNLRTKI